jgi:hypothetical protein
VPEVIAMGQLLLLLVLLLLLLLKGPPSLDTPTPDPSRPPLPLGACVPRSWRPQC